MKHILIVDDNKTNLTLAKHELSNEYLVTPVISGFQALQFLEKKSTDLILLDISMPEMDGRETMKKIKANSKWAKIPIIFLTADSTPETEAQCLSDGADDFIAKPFVPEVMKSRISRTIELSDLRNELEQRLKEKTKQVELVTLDAIMAIAHTIEAKDPYTSGHSIRVARCSVDIAKRMGLPEEDIKNLNYMALLHDIGKIGVPDYIINKGTGLEPKEKDIIRLHPTIGSDILSNITVIPGMKQGALYHHERYDGTGYPSGKRGEEIPLLVRIISIADSYDAMTSDRSYRKALPDLYVIEELKECRGTQFDPNIVDVFIEMLMEGYSLK